MSVQPVAQGRGSILPRPTSISTPVKVFMACMLSETATAARDLGPRAQSMDDGETGLSPGVKLFAILFTLTICITCNEKLCGNERRH